MFWNLYLTTHEGSNGLSESIVPGSPYEAASASQMLMMLSEVLTCRARAFPEINVVGARIEKGD